MSIYRFLDRAGIQSSRDWGDWETRVTALLTRLVDGPVHILIFGVPDGRYLQMMLGHGRGFVEVSTSTTFSSSGAHVELIAKKLIDSGFNAPVWSPGPGPMSTRPNWSLELAEVQIPLLADFVAAALRDLMQVGVAEVLAEGFMVDHPCARCHWDAA